MVSNGSEDGQRAKISTVATHTKPVQVTAYCGELLSTVAQLIVILSEESLEFLSCTFLTTEMPDDFRAVGSHSYKTKFLCFPLTVVIGSPKLGLASSPIVFTVS